MGWTGRAPAPQRGSLAGMTRQVPPVYAKPFLHVGVSVLCRISAGSLGVTIVAQRFSARIQQLVLILYLASALPSMGIHVSSI